MGADMWAAEILLRMKEQQAYQDVELCLALPFEGYDSDWDDWHRKRMDFIRRYAEKVLILCETPSSESYKKRNYYMVEQAGYMIAVYSDSVTSPLRASRRASSSLIKGWDRKWR